jgi:hypothetical protein
VEEVLLKPMQRADGIGSGDRWQRGNRVHPNFAPVTTNGRWQNRAGAASVGRRLCSARRIQSRPCLATFMVADAFYFGLQASLDSSAFSSVKPLRQRRGWWCPVPVSKLNPLMSLEREEEWTRTAASLKIELGLNEFDDDKVHSFFLLLLLRGTMKFFQLGLTPCNVLLYVCTEL